MTQSMLMNLVIPPLLNIESVQVNDADFTITIDRADLELTTIHSLGFLFFTDAGKGLLLTI